MYARIFYFFTTTSNGYPFEIHAPLLSLGSLFTPG